MRNARVTFGITKFIAIEELPGTIFKVREVARGRRHDHKGARGPYSDYKITIVTNQPLNLDRYYKHFNKVSENNEYQVRPFVSELDHEKCSKMQFCISTLIFVFLFSLLLV